MRMGYSKKRDYEGREKHTRDGEDIFFSAAGFRTRVLITIVREWARRSPPLFKFPGKLAWSSGKLAIRWRKGDGRGRER